MWALVAFVGVPVHEAASTASNLPSETGDDTSASDEDASARDGDCVSARGDEALKLCCNSSTFGAKSNWNTLLFFKGCGDLGQPLVEGSPLDRSSAIL